jgi:hypothetical protein
MGKILAVILGLSISFQVFPQTVIKGRSAASNVNITHTSSGTTGSTAVIKERSPEGYVNIIQEVTIKPPQLQAENLQFVDSDGNNFLNAGENARIFFTVRNSGEGPALNLEAKISEKNRIPGLIFQPKSIGTLQPGEVKTIEIAVAGNLNTTNSNASFYITLNELNGFGTDVGNIVVPTKAILAPMVSVAEIDFGNSPVRKNEKFDVKVLLQNTGEGPAENVNVTLSLVENIFLTSGSKSSDIGNLAPGESREITYTLITNNNYNLSKVILPFIISEKYGKYADNGKSTATIPLDLQLTASKQVIVQGEEKPAPETRTAVTSTSYISDVDRDIPVIPSKNQNRVALIIGNEDYSKAYNPESNVDFANNDAKIFAEYAKKILGIEDKFVLITLNATASIMRNQIKRAIDIVKVMGASSEIIFYYAGHGFPDQATKIPYLIPVDVSASNLSEAIKLADVYTQLGSSGAGKVTVLLDACFSGGGRDMGPLSARSVRMVPESEDKMINGNMVVFAASTGDQTAQALKKEKHGLFTYYLLKKLKETSGNITYNDLFDYILKSVQIDALTENNNPQVPVLISSDVVGDKWKSWKLK